MIKIEQLTINDAAAYQRLRLFALQESPIAFGSTYAAEVSRPLEMVAARLEDDRNDVVGAFDDRQLVGVVTLRREPPGKTDHKAYLFGLYVLPEHRLHGVGRALLETTISRARERGLRQIQLSVTAANRPAVHLYESCGFKQYGLEHDAFRDGDKFYDVAHMALPLSDDEE